MHAQLQLAGINLSWKALFLRGPQFDAGEPHSLELQLTMRANCDSDCNFYDSNYDSETSDDNDGEDRESDLWAAWRMVVPHDLGINQLFDWI